MESVDDRWPGYDPERWAPGVAAAVSNFDRVALQLPDSRLAEAGRLAAELRAAVGPKPVVCVLADSSNGSACCVDEVAAEHYLVDAVVHFGPACHARSRQGVPALFVYERDEVDERGFAGAVGEACAAALPAASAALPAALLIYEVQFHHCIERLALALLDAGHPEVFVAVAPLTRYLPGVSRCAHEFECAELSGRRVCRVVRGEAAAAPEAAAPAAAAPSVAEASLPAAPSAQAVASLASLVSLPKPETPPAAPPSAAPPSAVPPLCFAAVANLSALPPCALVLLASLHGQAALERPFPRRVLAQYAQRFPAVVFDASAGRCVDARPALRRFFAERFAAATRAAGARRVAIVCGTVAVGGTNRAVAGLARAARRDGRAVHRVVMGKVSPTKAANFTDVDAFCYVNCPESAFVEQPRDFFRPVLTPFELLVACNALEWSLEHKLEIDELLLALEQGEQGTLNGGEGAQLVPAPLRETLVPLCGRSFQGVLAKREASGEGGGAAAQGAEILDGLSGIASAYDLPSGAVR